MQIRIQNILMVLASLVSLRAVAQKNMYHEDVLWVLAPYDTVKVPEPEMPKPKEVVPPTHHQNAMFDSLHDVLIDKYANLKYTKGWRIQLYAGQNEQLAKQAQRKVKELLGYETHVYFAYYKPNFRVKIGDYINKLDAFRLYNELKAEFPSALLIPDKIDIRKIY